jgi:hypothetical protein
MGRVNLKQLRKEIRPAVISSLSGSSYRVALSEFKRIKKEELTEFKNSDVSIELNEGNQAAHRAGILEEGNLFSFLGFEKGRKPANELAQILNEHMSLSKEYTISEDLKGNPALSFPINIPTQKEIEGATPSPAISSRSWVSEIEKGISGLTRYVYYEFFRGGRSKTGLQARKKGGDSRAKSLPYVSEFLRKFRERFQ